MFGKYFELNEQSLPVVEEIGRHMPGGFYIYQAATEEVLFINGAALRIYGCADLEEFRVLTGCSFRGMVHPEDYQAVTERIQEQIAGGQDGQDYVEYRIIRRDGAVRWVDDYGHFTQTEAYGGVYFVFLSDITEKRERMETDLAVRRAVIEALSKSYHTVWLINDVETGTFALYRGDTRTESIHAEPIHAALKRMLYPQAKVHYIETRVAPEDRERLQRELDLTHLAKRLQTRPRVHINYLRLMDDGSQRYFRIEFAKVDMPGGKTGVVCGFKDVDEDVREAQAMQQALREAKETEERVKRQELEEKLALQEQLLERQREGNQQSQMITAMASDYRCVYYVSLDTGRGVCYRTDHSFEDALRVGDSFDFATVFTAYARQFVAEPYREGFLSFIDPEKIRERLLKKPMITYRYLRVHDGRETYEMLRMAGVRRAEDRDDHLVHAIGVGFTDIDAETRESMARNEALRDALQAAEEANKAKTAFLSNMSHEIRTPMNAIIGLNNIAINDPETPDKTREYLGKIGTSAQHLLNIINDILDMSRIESGRMTIRSEEFSLSQALEQVNTIINGQCRDKGLAYECRVHGRMDDYYIGDDMKLRQVMINILGNAVKFTPAGGHVSLIIEEAARFDRRVTLRMTMRDDGIGMSREYLPRLFETFSQEDSSTTSKYGSTGLGMPITKSIVEMMNGTIEVKSEKGKGTTFVVTVTLGESDRRRAEALEDALQPHEISALVIDDDPIAREHAQVVLGQLGISCDIAASGQEAVEMVRLRHARREEYKLILVDWKMPGMDGVETTRAIRSIVGQHTAIIILTSYNWDEVADEARRAGVDSFVPKPLFADSVMEKFREAYQRKSENTSKPAVELAGRRVMLTEDVPVNAEIMMMILSARSLAVEHAENGRQAVDMYAAHPAGYYDAILMDVRMPEMDGLEATRVIRAMGREDSAAIPIIALTANAFDEDVQRSMQAGLNAHLSKPVDPENLFSTLEGLIRP